MSKKVLCIDTGELFNTIGAAAKPLWVLEIIYGKRLNPV